MPLFNMSIHTGKKRLALGSLLMTDTAASGPEIGSAPQKGSGLGSKDRTAHVCVAA